MATLYTSNSGIIKPGSGEQSGTWGTSVNPNFDIIDRAISGYGDVDLSSSGAAKTVLTTNGALSEGGYAVLNFSGATEACTVTLSPNTKGCVYIARNAGSFNVVIQQGSGSTVTLLAGGAALVWADGGGATANVRALDLAKLTANLDVNGNSIVSTSNGNIVLAPNGTGDVHLDADTVRVGDSNANATITTNGTGDLILNTNSGTNSGTVTIADGVNGNISFAPNGTGEVQVTGGLTVTGDLDVDNLNVNGNTISSTDTNGNIVFVPDGTGEVQVTGGVTVTGDLDVDNLNVNGNTISSTDTNGDIVLSPDGTGSVNIGTDLELGASLWKLVIDGTKVGFSYNGTLMFSISTSGAVIAKDDITAFGTP